METARWKIQSGIIFPQHFSFSPLAVTVLNGNMHSVLSAGDEGQACLLRML